MHADKFGASHSYQLNGKIDGGQFRSGICFDQTTLFLFTFLINWISIQPLFTVTLQRTQKLNKTENAVGKIQCNVRKKGPEVIVCKHFTSLFTFIFIVEQGLQNRCQEKEKFRQDGRNGSATKYPHKNIPAKLSPTKMSPAKISPYKNISSKNIPGKNIPETKVSP